MDLEQVGEKSVNFVKNYIIFFFVKTLFNNLGKCSFSL